jgi:RNAse (barnase) inhibitor barstar
MKNIEFLASPETYVNSDEFIIHLKDVHGEDNLLNELSNCFHFPDYFGFNWNAVYDCLRDFHWITNKGIVLVHDNLPKLDKSILSNYVNVLIDAVADWKEDEEHYFKVIFPEKDKEVITNTLMNN